MAQRLILLAVSSLAAGAALAQPLSDPTRPPSREGAAELRQADVRGSRLQSVLISPARSVAVIDGRTVRVGERVGDATVVSIAASEVTLQRGSGRETLTLLPARIDKKPVKP
jgi:MSHA biogenesis protein MshK